MFKKRLGLEKLNARKLCVLAMLTALTVLLAVYGTFRIGNMIKIPTKFVTVFIAAALYGPIWGGVVAALGDLLNAFLVPVGPWLPQITAVEFLYGFIFGLFFFTEHAKTYEKNYLLRTILCALTLTFIDIFPMSWILTTVGYFPSVGAAIVLRIYASVIKLALYIVVCLLLKRYLKSFERLIHK